MQKIFISLILTMLTFGLHLNPVFADTIIMPDGEVVKGKIQTILRHYIQINTKDGERSITRLSNDENIRDIIEVGFIKKKKMTGEIIFLSNDYLDFRNANSQIKIKRYKVRNIIISPKNI